MFFEARDKMNDYYVATFYSTSQALRFEKIMKSNGQQVTMIPVPRIISSSCGIAARFAKSQWPVVESLLTTGTGDAEEVYFFTTKGKELYAERIWHK